MSGAGSSCCACLTFSRASSTRPGGGEITTVGAIGLYTGTSDKKDYVNSVPFCTCPGAGRTASPSRASSDTARPGSLLTSRPAETVVQASSHLSPRQPSVASLRHSPGGRGELQALNRADQRPQRALWDRAGMRDGARVHPCGTCAG